MDAKQSLLIMSWSTVCEDLPGFSHRFFESLFMTYPSLRTPSQNLDVDAQDRHLQVVLGALTRGQLSTNRLIALGRCYAGYGVQSAHYTMIVQTLLWALEQQLGTSWTLAMHNAWDDALSYAAGIMVASDRRQRYGQYRGENVMLFLSFH